VELDVQSAVGLLAIITFLATTATVIAFGFQRGRVQRLEASNEDLRKDLTDERARGERRDADLHDAQELTRAQHDELVDLRAKVSTMTEVVHGVTGPIANLVSVVEQTNRLITAHNDTALRELAKTDKRVVQVLRLMGDKRADTDDTGEPA
jgi:hypothetical protein